MKKYLLLISIFSALIFAEDARDFHRYLYTNYKQFCGDLLGAQRGYQELIKSNASPYTYKGYIHFLYNSGQYNEIARLAPQLEKKFAKDADLGLIFAQAFKRIGDTKEADRRIIQLSQIHKNHPEIILNAVESYVQRKERANALSLIDTFLNSAAEKPNFFVFHFLKAQIFAQMQQLDKALEETKKALKMHPNFPQGWLFKAMLEEQAGQYDAAIKGLHAYIEKSGENKTQIQQYIAALTAKQLLARPNPFGIISLNPYQKALGFYKQKNFTLALTQINHALEQNPKDEEARMLKIQILVAMREVDKAINQLVLWASEPHDQLWSKTLHLLVRANAPIAKIMDGFKQIEAKKPNESIPLLYLADLYIRAQQHDNAINYLEKIASHPTSDTQLKAKALFQLAMIYYHSGNNKQAQEILMKGEALQTDFLPLLNLLAYHYATEGKNITKADELITAVLKKNKSNPHYLDTKALVLYKQQRYPQAIALLEKIIERNPQDSTILIHLAKAQHKQGLKTQSLQTIKAAKSSAPLYNQSRIEKLVDRWKKETTPA